MDDCVAISVVRDWATYDKYVAQNQNLLGWSREALDNSEENLPIPVRYNAFLDGYDYSKPAWLVFCHEDFEFEENIAGKLNGLDKGRLYGPVGSKRGGFCGIGMQRVLGQIKACAKDGSKLRVDGVPTKFFTEVDTFDCCCLIVHSSLVEKFHLRFDPILEFDLYVEDFCALANVNHGVKSVVLPFVACHHSDSRATGRLYRHLPYLKKKYPHNCFCGTCAYFGAPPLLMRLEDWLLKKVGIK